MDIVTAYNEDRTVKGNYKDLDAAISALTDQGYEVVSRNEYGAIMERLEQESKFYSQLLNPEYGPYITPKSTVSIEPSRVSGL